MPVNLEIDSLFVTLTTVEEQRAISLGLPYFAEYRHRYTPCDVVLVSYRNGEVFSFHPYPRGISSCDGLELIISEIQEVIIQEIDNQWPLCSDHSHPMRAVCCSGEVSWRCPLTDERIRRVGEVPRT